MKKYCDYDCDQSEIDKLAEKSRNQSSSRIKSFRDDCASIRILAVPLWHGKKKNFIRQIEKKIYKNLTWFSFCAFWRKKSMFVSSTCVWMFICPSPDRYSRTDFFLTIKKVITPRKTITKEKNWKLRELSESVKKNRKSPLLVPGFINFPYWK